MSCVDVCASAAPGVVASSFHQAATWLPAGCFAADSGIQQAAAAMGRIKPSSRLAAAAAVRAA
eukprot:357281-Chlamydomonas_euryale.AAC.21